MASTHASSSPFPVLVLHCLPMALQFSLMVAELCLFFSLSVCQELIVDWSSEKIQACHQTFNLQCTVLVQHYKRIAVKLFSYLIFEALSALICEKILARYEFSSRNTSLTYKTKRFIVYDAKLATNWLGQLCTKEHHFNAFHKVIFVSFSFQIGSCISRNFRNVPLSHIWEAKECLLQFLNGCKASGSVIVAILQYSVAFARYVRM